MRAPRGAGCTAAALVALGLAGCDASGVADGLGTFSLTATLTEACATAGILAVPAQHEAVVQLTQVGSALHWREGSRLFMGTVDDHHEFRVGGYLKVDMRQDTPDEALPQCYVERQDEKLGVLDFDAAGDCVGFSAQLLFHVAPTADSDCADLQGPDAPLPETLPCTVVYEAQGTPL